MATVKIKAATLTISPRKTRWERQRPCGLTRSLPLSVRYRVPPGGFLRTTNPQILVNTARIFSPRRARNNTEKTYLGVLRVLRGGFFREIRG